MFCWGVCQQLKVPIGQPILCCDGSGKQTTRTSLGHQQNNLGFQARRPKSLFSRCRPTTLLQDAVGNSQTHAGALDSVDSEPGQQGRTNKCYLCHAPVDLARRLCSSCYDAGKPFPDDQCSVCHVRFNRSENVVKVSLPATYFVDFLAYLRGDKEQAVKLREEVFNLRDLSRCPLRADDPLCGRPACVYKHRQKAVKRGDVRKPKHDDPTYGLSGRPPMEEAEPGAECHMCPTKLDQSTAKRRAGTNYESWEHFFRILKQPVKVLGKFTPATRACNPCYMDWYNNHAKREQPGNFRRFEGAKSYNEAADGEQRRLGPLEKEIASCADDKICKFYLGEKIKLLFRRRVLQCFLGANEYTTSTDLREVLRGIINDVDPEARLEILKSEEGAQRNGEAENRRKLDRWVTKQLSIIEETVPVGHTPATVKDGRQRPLYFPLHLQH